MTTQSSLCLRCVEQVPKIPPMNMDSPEIAGVRHLEPLAEYSPSTGTITPLPRMAVYLDHDVHNDGQIIANVALTHETVHWWLHQNVSYLACVQFDNIAHKFNNRLYEILDENFPDTRNPEEGLRYRFKTGPWITMKGKP